MYSVNTFLDKTYSESLLERSQQSDPPLLVSFFAQALFSVSFHALPSDLASSPESRNQSKVSQRLRSLPDAYRNVKNSQDSLLKLQVIRYRF